MEIRYSREMSHNYMIIEAPENEKGYEARMLSANIIEGLLKFRVRQTEESEEYYYEITSRQPLKRVLEKRVLSGRELRSILLGVMGVIRRVEEYLLKEEQLLLDPEYIYIEPDQFTVNLCLVPGYTQDTPTSISKLLEYLLERVDHQDREAVVLAYNLYQISLRENYGMADLMRKLSGADQIFFSERGKENEVHSEISETGDEKRETTVKETAEKEEKSVYETSSVVYGNTSVTGGLDRADGEREKRHKKNKRRWPNCVIRVIGCAAVAGIVYWYITGETNIFLYMIMAAAGILTFVREYFAGKRKQRLDTGNADDNVRNKCGNDNNSSEQERHEKENRWMVYPESEEVRRQELRREEEVQIERLKEAGTTLLSEVKNKDGMARLEPLEAGAAVIQISYVPFTLGKHPELSDACIDRPTVSRLHVRIDRKEGVYILTDLNSTNGTSVNGYQLQANETVSLGNGDSIYMADAGYKFWEN